MRVHCLQHVPFEGLGSLGPWLEARGATLTATRFFEDPRLPAPDAVDWVIALGGPMSVNDEERLPWLAAEKTFLREALACNRRILGICLGAQLLASACGAKVGRNREREIGWFPISPTPAAATHPVLAALPPVLEVFHWHGETFELPAGALHAARSAGCGNQAFALGARAVGLQFHLETTPQAARGLVAHCAGDLAPGTWVQTPEAMLAEPRRFERVNAVMTELAERLAQA
jgi:GMP synthase-like glutamine amidotransferase